MNVVKKLKVLALYNYDRDEKERNGSLKSNYVLFYFVRPGFEV